MAGVQVWLMLETVGRKKPKFNERRLSLAHRINGYLFLALYLIFLVVMIQKIADSNAPLDTKAMIHMTLAVAILPLLLIKILIVRFYPNLFDVVVPLIGIGIFVLAVSFVSITGGYYFIKSATTKYVSSFNPQSGILDVDIGRQMVIQTNVTTSPESSPWLKPRKIGRGRLTAWRNATPLGCPRIKSTRWCTF